MNKMIYLDNAATTFPKSERVYDAMDWFNRNQCVNAGRGGYRLAREATKLIDETKESLLSLLNLPLNRQVIFTPSATIALNQIIFGLEWNQLKNIYVTPFEHNAIMRPLHKIASTYDIKIRIIPFNKATWEIDVDQMQKDFAINNPDYIFMSHMSNVTGYILPCEKVLDASAQYSPTTVIDCSQSLGTVPIKKEILDADFLVFAGHKSLYGPMGIGGFISKEKISLEPVILGGTGTESLNLEMPKAGASRYEAASYNIQAIAGLNESIRWIREEGITNIYKHKKVLTEMLINVLREKEEIKLYLPDDLEKHCNIVSFNLSDWKSEDLGIVLDEDFNIAVRTGYHCSPLVHDFLDTKNLLGTVRVSVGYFNNNEDIDKLIQAIQELIEG
nr:aminotransferase class V-fold PLP-dependent enzyme [uncultured Cellulosilyticum sp.]